MEKKYRSDIHQIEMPPRGYDEEPMNDSSSQKAFMKQAQSSQISLTRMKNPPEKKNQTRVKLEQDIDPSSHIVHNSLALKNRKALAFKATRARESPSRRSTGNIAT